MNKPSIQILISSPLTNPHFQKNSKFATILSKSTHIYQTHLDAITVKNSATMKRNTWNHLFVKSADRVAQTTLNSLATSPSNVQIVKAITMQTLETVLSGKKEKEINTIKYTNNISFPEARKLIQSRNQFPTRSYAQVTTSNPEPKHDHSCGPCHMILEKLIHLTPENLPKFVNDLKTSLSKSQQLQPSTSQLPAPQIQTAPPKEVSPRVNTPQETQSPKLPVRRDNRSPIRGLRQSPTPRQRIQLEKTNSKIDFLFFRMRSLWNVGHHHLPPLLPRLSTVGKILHRLQNLNGQSPINNDHWTMANQLIQWNCRGLKANFNELLLLLTGLFPSIICLQETFLKPSDNLNIRGYDMYNHIHQSGDRASCGSSIVVNNSIP